ncbi:MAG TPA: PaaI family thioesterase [Prolixibacteraceae bacterium]|nr:PaaI family thioesterase [Prolixibacteraceae bacterium]
MFPKLTITTPMELINQYIKNTMVDHLGICFTALGEGWVEASMPVDHRTLRPGGFLHGGANLALAETVAGLGSMLGVDIQEFDILGIQVSANHISSVAEGTVYARAEIVHSGNQTHVWNVEIRTEAGKLISTGRVTNMIVKRYGK